jgi:hypothetical protein
MTRHETNLRRLGDAARRSHSGDRATSGRHDPFDQ